MAVPKKKKSKSKARSHRAARLAALGRRPAQRLPAVRRRQAAPRRVPDLRLVQGPRRRRRRLTASPLMLPIAVDAMGGDRAPGEIVAGARQAVDEPASPSSLVGRRRTSRHAATCPLHRGVRGHRDGRRPGRRRAPQEGLVARARGRGGPRRQGRRRWSRPATPARRWRPRCCGWAGSRASAGPAIATPIPVPGSTRADRPPRRRRQRRVPARVAGAVRPDGLGATPATASASTSPGSGCCRSARSRRKGDTLRQGDPRAARARRPGVDFIGNVEGRDILTDDVDVVVTDGFTGNVVLKTLGGRASRLDHRRCSSGASTATDEYRRCTPSRCRPALDAALRAARPRDATAGRCCSASTGCASSATARRAPGPWSTPSGWRRRWWSRTVVGELRAAVAAG